MIKISFFIIIFFIFFFIIPRPVEALVQTQRALLNEQIKQKIEIIKFELELLQSLLFNMKKEQKITAGSYLVINISDNSILLSKNANQAYPIASITKLMTAVIAQENIKKNQTIILTNEMLQPLGQSPSLFRGLNISAENLLKANLIQSSNDASQALSHFLDRGIFLNKMNQKTKELGMTNTIFFDTHGLNPKNRSTATDLAKLLTYIYQKHPEILNITKNNNFWLPNIAGQLLKFQNVNNFYPLSNFIGGKTGFLPQARQTIASIFNINEKSVIIILLFSNNRQADVFSLIKQLEK